MDAVTTLRELWRRRRYVAAVCAIALLAAAAFTFNSHRYSVAVASVRILVDTPSSQVVQVAPKGSDTLGTRADLLASVMIDGTVKSDIANRAGLQPGQLVGVTDAATQPSATGPAPVSTPTGPQGYVLSTQVLTDSAGNELPIIEVDAQAPTTTAATKLADAAVTGLRAYLNSTAALQRIAQPDRLQLIGLGAPQASTEVRGSSRAIGLVIAILVFVVGCGVILAVVALVRGWRAASVREQAGEQPAPTGMQADDRNLSPLLSPPVQPPSVDDEVPAAFEDDVPVWDDVLGPDEPYFEERPQSPSRKQPSNRAASSDPVSGTFLDRRHKAGNGSSGKKPAPSQPAARAIRPSEPIRRSAT